MDELETRIEALKIQLESIRRAERYRQELENNLPLLRAKLDRLAVTMDKEYREIEELEKWSLQELFVKIIDKEERLALEKEEYLQAAMACREAKQELELLEFEVKVLQEKTAAGQVVELELRKLYELRQTEILSRNKDHPLRPVVEQLTRWNQLIRELEEAIVHGVNVQLLLEGVARHLIQAKSWTANPADNPAYSKRVLAEEIDGARLRLPKLRIEFAKFKKELEEVCQYPEFQGGRDDQWDELRQVEALKQDLFQLTKGFLLSGTRNLGLIHQLHRTHTLVDNLARRIIDQVKWLRLEQSRANREISRLRKEREELLGREKG